MTPSLLSLVLSLISAAWGMWGATNHPPVIVNYEAGPTVYAAGDTIGPIAGVCYMTIYDPFVIIDQVENGFIPTGMPRPHDVLPQIIAHEVGHCLGLDHSTLTTDLMYPTAPVSAPSWHDLYRYHQTFAHRVHVAGY